jgi:pyruvate kinase
VSTKILATIGPSSLNKDTIFKLEKNGVDLLRINLSHTKIEDLKGVIKKIQGWSSVPICLDSEGAQIRNQDMRSEAVDFKKGEKVKIHRNFIEGDSKNISLTPSNVYEQLLDGDVIHIDFHSVALKIIQLGGDTHISEVVSSGRVGSNKAVSIDRDIKLSPVTEKDVEAFEIGKSMGIENFSLSFTNTAEDVRVVRKIIGNSNLISKIESIKGVLNLTEILPLVDQILIDRGDLSREVDIAKIPFIQRRIIAHARSKNTPVYVATNLLESMIHCNLPTRAEVNDIASTLLMGADGLVLAAETAIGKYPVQTIEVVNAVIKQFNRWTPESSSIDIIYD